MDSKQIRIVTMVAAIVGITVFGLVIYFGSIAALPASGGGAAVVFIALAALRYKKTSAAKL